MVPPVGAIIIGPCPQCKEMVVVFCGQVLALDKDVMENGSADERKEHLLSVLTEFLDDRIGKMMEAAPTEEGAMSEDFDVPSDQAGGESESESPEERKVQQQVVISQSEFDRFLEVDLNLLDNKAYFKSVFG